ncbi:Rap guanine nucleotide exchange factor 5 [Acipenser ruthenus]|uniref:Rap guanine nucleotide exchange factor 5 n=1 Tax=Acipenser ruthenus TaxID=7906 RepID=A0A444TXH1_ACIRT|nr:Rap guanine nucleotide exchange factor 5 [Acipenser ruthenus]
MGSARLRVFDLRLEGKVVPATLVEEEDEEEDEEEYSSSGEAALPTFDVPYFRYIDDEEGEEVEEGEETEEEEWSSSRSLSSTEEDSADSSVVSDRYVVVSGTPEKILEHLLSDLRLDESQGPQCKETETLLDDFLLTGKEETSDALFRKRKVLHLVSQWTALYRDVLREDEHVKLFIKTLYRYVLDDLYEYPSLEKDLTEFQKLLRIHRRHTVDEYSPHRKSKALFHQFSLKENWLQHREAHNETKEVLCRVYITNHSYLSIMTSLSATAQEVLKTVAEMMEYAEEELALVTVTFPGEKHILQPHDIVNSESLTASGRLLVCRKDLSEILNPFTDNEKMQHRAVRMLGMNTWDVALALTNFDWNLFNSIHEQELIHYTFSRQGSGRNTVCLDLLLQRCNEVQLWVMTEILLCSLLCKRVQLVKKFIKIAAHCRAQRNVNSFFAIIMGLNNVAVSRLSQTWEDPSLNHKAYRDAFRKMKPPKIPFMPLLLKDITFIHEGNKTFLDNLVNFEKLHMIADAVRFIRHCRPDQLGQDGPQKAHQDVKTFVHHLHIIDNQQTLFGLSLSLEPRL